MTTALAEVLRAGAPTPTRDVNFEAIEARLRRRRRHHVVAGGLAIAIVVGAGSVIGLVLRAGTEPPSISTQTPSSSVAGRTVTGRSVQGPVSITAPDGWHAIPLGTSTGPSEILAIATVPARPTPDVITACRPGDVPAISAAYISIFEYLPGTPLVVPADNGFFTDGSFKPRPKRIDPVPALGGSCSDPTTGMRSSFFRMLPFAENGRRFLVRVVTTGDPNGEMLAATGPILDTLSIGH